MHCNEVNALVEPYVLGALESQEKQAVDVHLQTCMDCSLKMREDGEALARLAMAVPQHEVPPRVKHRLFSRIAQDLGAAGPVAADEPAAPRGRPSSLWEAVSRPLSVRAGWAMATMLVLLLAISGVWIDARLGQLSADNRELSVKFGQISSENQAITQYIATVFAREAQFMSAVSEQRYLASMTASPGVGVKMLWGTENSAEAWGMVACCAVTETGPAALIAVLNLDPLPDDKVYQIWVFTKYQRFGVGLLRVDSTGYAQAVIIPVVPFDQVLTMGVTIEPAGGSPDPTGDSVLAGEM